MKQSDHDMAVLASTHLDTLETATHIIEGDPTACRSDRNVSCTWVPAGIAVRAEMRKLNEWVSAR